MNSYPSDPGTDTHYNTHYQTDGKCFWIYAEVTRIIHGKRIESLEILLPKTPVTVPVLSAPPPPPLPPDPDHHHPPPVSPERGHSHEDRDLIQSGVDA